MQREQAGLLDLGLLDGERLVLGQAGAQHLVLDHGDRDGDGFVEYGRRRSDGLVNQGWKDSQDAVFHADGTLARGPIALVEDGWPILGIIDQPVQRERWLGVAGRPTTFNGASASPPRKRM